MIDIKLSDKSYVNDVYPLVKAFYPRETIHINSGETRDSRETKDSAETEGAAGHFPAGRIGEEDSCVILCIHICFLESTIEISMQVESQNVFTEKLDIQAGNVPKPLYKNAMKRLLYGMLSKTSSNKLPWGILTGIRPTKLVYQMLEEGCQEEIIYEKMKKEYLCSKEKIAMSIRIAKRERELLQEMDYQNGYSLYIGIPFCPSTCLYCSFPSYSIDRFATYVAAYLKALEKEIIFGSSCFPDKKLTTVYFGGGTPTTLSAAQLDMLLNTVKKYFDFTYVKEFCVEAGRPDSITPQKLEVLKKNGVNRISINPQSMQQKTLDLIGRKHTVEQVQEAFRLAREYGHDNINMDIIIGLPGETEDDVRDTLQQIKMLDPESLTVHTLALKRAARLNMEKENYRDLQAGDVPAMLETSMRFAKENDYFPYYLYRQKNMAYNLENIGYSKFQKEGLYNILIMEEQQTILALGAGAMTKLVLHNPRSIDRVDNVKNVKEYIERIDEMIERKRRFFHLETKLGGRS
jgi:coproporphyrinogen dehydrogenase HemZ